MLVALAGGSVIDGAKAVQLCLWTNANDSTALDNLQNLRARDIALPAQSQRMAAVPTTLSGAEFTDFAGISNAQGRKESFARPLMAPLAISWIPSPRAQRRQGSPCPRVDWTTRMNVNLFKTFALKWWQAGIFKAGMLALGIMAGLEWLGTETTMRWFRQVE